jgi:dTDP-4-amino-4,6-dideoxygalactose transaminase
VPGAFTALLSERHERRRVIPVGNGTAALCLLLKALGLRDRDIAVPDSVCINVPLAVLLSGNRPVFLDVEEDTLGLSPDRLEAHVGPLGAVVAVHAYGAPCRIERLAAICSARGIPLLEDFALAQGARVGGRPAGAFGRASFVSFGAGKILSYGIGAALLTDDDALADAVAREEAALPACTESHRAGVEDLMKAFRTLYNRWLGRDLNGFWKEFRERARAAGPSFLHRFDPAWAPGLGELLGDLDRRLEVRRRREERLRGLLAAAGAVLRPWTPPPGSVPWRFNAFVTGDRNGLLKHLLERKFKASSWYGPADLFFGPRSGRTGGFGVSDRVGDRILNLWVGEDVDEEYAPAVAGEILRYFGSRVS